jgi:hypothetical protein
MYLYSHIHCSSIQKCKYREKKSLKVHQCGNEFLKSILCIYTLVYCPGLKTFTTTWMDLKDIMLSEIS